MRLAFIFLVSVGISGCAAFRSVDGEPLPVSHGAAVAAQAFKENAPANPTSLTGWAIAAAMALIAGTTATVSKMKKPTEKK